MKSARKQRDKNVTEVRSCRTLFIRAALMVAAARLDAQQQGMLRSPNKLHIEDANILIVPITVCLARQGGWFVNLLSCSWCVPQCADTHYYYKYYSGYGTSTFSGQTDPQIGCLSKTPTQYKWLNMSRPMASRINRFCLVGTVHPQETDQYHCKTQDKVATGRI